MIPFATTTIDITRTETSQLSDPYDPDPPAPTVIATGVRATISNPAATTALSGGTRVDFTARFMCDPCGIEVGDQVTDTSDGTVWFVLWVKDYGTFGLGHMTGQLRLVEGAT